MGYKEVFVRITKVFVGTTVWFGEVFVRIVVRYVKVHVWITVMYDEVLCRLQCMARYLCGL